MVKFDSINIQTDRLNLRPITMQDLDEVYAIYADVQTMKFWSEPPMQFIAQAKEKIMQSIQANENGTALSLVVELKETQQMIGQISMYNFHQASARAEIGYVLSRKQWQKGLMSEALLAFIAFCFTELNLRRLEADIDPDNTASAALLQNMGFDKEGYLKQRWVVDGLMTDSALYGLLKSTWQNTKAR